MRTLSLLVLLTLALALPVAAHPVAGFPYNLTFSGGTITGTFGGVPVTGTYTGTTSGSFTLLVDGKTFATGTYSCTSSGCTFTGTEVLGAGRSFTFTSTSLASPAKGSLSGLYPTHGAWVSAVAKWAQANLTTMRVGQIVRAAASIQGQSKKPSATSQAKEHGNKGKGRNK